ASHQLGANASPAVASAAAGLVLGEDGVASGSPLANAGSLLIGTLAGELDLAPESRAIVDTALDLTRDVSLAGDYPDPWFRALAHSGRVDLIEEAFAYVNDPNELVRRAANEALGALDGDPRVTERLLETVRSDESAMVRSAAADVLGKLEPSAEVTSGLAAVAVDDADPVGRARALAALSQLALQGSEPARAELERLAAQGDESVRANARDHLADVGAANRTTSMEGALADRAS